MVQKTTIKRKHSYDCAPFQQKKGVKRRRVNTTASVSAVPENTENQSPNVHENQSPYHFISPEREDLSSFLADERLNRSAKRRLVFRKTSRPGSSHSQQLSFPNEPKQSTRKTSRKRPLSQILDDSIEETLIKGKHVQKKHKKVLSDSMQEDFYLTEDDEDESDLADCDKSADDIFVNEKSDGAVIPKFVSEVNGDMKLPCRLIACRKHNNPDKHPKCCRGPYLDCSFRAKPTTCPVEMVQLVEHCQMKRCLFREYASEYHTILKQVDYGNGRSPTVYLYGEALLTLCNKQQQTLHIDRTFNLGNCYVTMFVFRNTNLIDTRSKKKYSPLMMGPVMLHFDTELETYTRFFEFVKQKTDIEYDFQTRLNRKMPKKDTVIADAVRDVFGTAVPLCGIYHQHGSARRTLREKVKCFDSLMNVIEQVTFLMHSERRESKECLQKRSLWTMVPRAWFYMYQYMDQAFPMKYLDGLCLSP